MHVVALLGSPRKKSSSSTIARLITGPLATRGHKVSHYCLNDLAYRGCQACGVCKSSSEKCALQDDLTPVLEEIRQADVIVLATPVYWGEVSAQMKGLIDRTYSFLTPGFMSSTTKHRLPPGKKLVYIQTQGAPAKELHDDIFPRYNAFFSQLGFFSQTYIIRGCGLSGPEELQDRSDLLQLAKQTASKLLA